MRQRPGVTHAMLTLDQQVIGQLAVAIDLAAVLPGVADQLRLADIFLGSPAQGSLEPGIKSARLYAQAAAHRPYREKLSMLRDERGPHLFGVALEPMAKCAVAFFRMSRSSVTRASSR